MKIEVILLSILWPICIVLLAMAVRSLDRIAAEIESGSLRGPQGKPGPQGPPVPSQASHSGVLASSGARKDISEVLQRDQTGKWVHHSWVQTDSDAERRALAMRGRAVKRHGEEIDLGIQS